MVRRLRAVSGATPSRGSRRVAISAIEPRSFLVDEEDTIDYYEAKGKEKIESEMDRAEQSLKRKVDEMGRIGQIEFVSGISIFN